jgi:adenylate kinase
MADKRLVFLGPPGSGKGTQAQRLCDRFSLTQLASGDLLRREVREKSEIGRKAAQFMESGVLVPDDVITGIMLLTIERLKPGDGFVLDGFPRTVPQAEALEAGLKTSGRPLQAVIDFKLDDAEIVRRITTRRVCMDCGAAYNTEFKPPKKAGVCDRCGGEVIQRVDDREETVRTRLATYRAQTEPLIGYYNRQGLLHSADASVGMDAVEQQVLRILETLGTGG